MSVNVYINFEVLLERLSEKFLTENKIYGRYVHIHILSMLLEDRVKTAGNLLVCRNVLGIIGLKIS